MVVADEGRQGTEDPPSVDLVLQNLTNRANVRSALILSRRDGSIIKTSGAIADDTPTQPQNRRSEDAAQNEDEIAAQEESRPTEAQMLASSIYHFVTAATVVGTTVRSVDNENSLFSGRPNAGGDSQPGDATTADRNAHAEDDIQLLRLRLKNQEVIIFPDSNYLCCVVQDLENAR